MRSAQKAGVYKKPLSLYFFFLNLVTGTGD